MKATSISEQNAALRQQLDAAMAQLAAYERKVNQVMLAITHYDAFKACEVIERVLNGRLR